MLKYVISDDFSTTECLNRPIDARSHRAKNRSPGIQSQASAYTSLYIRVRAHDDGQKPLHRPPRGRRAHMKNVSAAGDPHLFRPLGSPTARFPFRAGRCHRRNAILASTHGRGAAPPPPCHPRGGRPGGDGRQDGAPPWTDVPTPRPPHANPNFPKNCDMLRGAK